METTLLGDLAILNTSLLLQLNTWLMLLLLSLYMTIISGLFSDKWATSCGRVGRPTWNTQRSVWISLPVADSFSGQFQDWNFSTRAPNKVVSDRILPSQTWRVEAPQWCNVDTVCECSFEHHWEERPRVEHTCLRGSSAHQGVRKVKIGHEMLGWLSVSQAAWCCVCMPVRSFNSSTFIMIPSEPLPWKPSRVHLRRLSNSSALTHLFFFSCIALANWLPRLQNHSQLRLMLIPRVFLDVELDQSKALWPTNTDVNCGTTYICLRNVNLKIVFG